MQVKKSINNELELKMLPYGTTKRQSGKQRNWLLYGTTNKKMTQVNRLDLGFGISIPQKNLLNNH